MRWGRPSSWRGRSHGLASFLSSGSEERKHFFFSPLIKTVAFPTSTARLVTPLIPPAGRGRLSLPLHVSQGVTFRGGGFGKKNSRKKKGRPAIRVANGGTKIYGAGK